MLREYRIADIYIRYRNAVFFVEKFLSLVLPIRHFFHGHEYIMFYNRDGTPQSGEGMHHPTCKKCKQLEKEGYYEHQFILKDGKNIHDPNCSVCKEWNN